MKLMSMQTMSVAAVRVACMIVRTVSTRVVPAIVLALDRGVIMVAMAARLGNGCN